MPKLSLAVPVGLALALLAPSTGLAGQKVRIEGVDSPTVKVMIRTVDDGDILWVGGYSLGTKASVSPGSHKLSVMCEFRQSWGSRLSPGQITIEAEAGKTYRLTGAEGPDSGDCVVTVSVVP